MPCCVMPCGCLLRKLWKADDQCYPFIIRNQIDMGARVCPLCREPDTILIALELRRSTKTRSIDSAAHNLDFYSNKTRMNGDGYRSDSKLRVLYKSEKLSFWNWEDLLSRSMWSGAYDNSEISEILDNDRCHRVL